MNLNEYRTAIGNFTQSPDFASLQDSEKQDQIKVFRDSFIKDNPDVDVAYVDSITENENKNFLRNTGRGRVVPDKFIQENNIIFPNQDPEFATLKTADQQKKIEEFKLKIPEIAAQNPTQKEDTEFFLNQSMRRLERQVGGKNTGYVGDKGKRAAEGFLSTLAQFTNMPELSESVQDFFQENTKYDQDIGAHLAQGLGSAGASIVVMAGIAATTRGLGATAASEAVTGGMIVANGILRYNEAYGKAIEAGLDTEKASEAGVASFPAAVIDTIGDKIIASKLMPAKINKVFSTGTEVEKKAIYNQILKENTLRGKLVEYSTAAIGEGLAESVGDYVAGYGPYIATKRDSFLPSADELKTSFLVGAFLGGGINAAIDLPDVIGDKKIVTEDENGKKITEKFFTKTGRDVEGVRRNLEAISGPEQKQVTDLLAKGDYSAAFKLSKSILKSKEEQQNEAPETDTELDVEVEGVDVTNTPKPTTTGTPKATTTAPKNNINSAPKTGWNAQWDLATIAEQEGVDLSSMTREEYADYAIDKGLEIDDNQLRMQPSLRNHKSMQDYLAAVKTTRPVTQEQIDADTAFTKYAIKVMDLSDGKNKTHNGQIHPGVEVRSGVSGSASWLYWKINSGAVKGATEVHKAYLGFKDIYKSMTPKRVDDFFKALQASGYNGDVKTVQDLGSQARISDQIVMHGATKADSELALKTAQDFFGEEIGFTDTGMDSDKKSYSELIAERIANGIKGKTSPTPNNQQAPAVLPSPELYTPQQLKENPLDNIEEIVDAAISEGKPVNVKLANSLGWKRISGYVKSGTGDTAVFHRKGAAPTETKKPTSKKHEAALEEERRAMEDIRRSMGTPQEDSQPMTLEEQLFEESSLVNGGKDISFLTGLINKLKNKKHVAAINQMITDLRTKNPDVRFVLIDIPSVGGAYMSANNTVYLNNAIFKSEKKAMTVIGHEISHALTQSDILRYVTNRTEGTYREKLSAAVFDKNTPLHMQSLINVYLHSAKAMGHNDNVGLFITGENIAQAPSTKDGGYAFTSLEEFVAEAYGSQRFQEQLSEIMYQGKTVWQTIVDAISQAMTWMKNIVIDEALLLRSDGENALVATMASINKIIQSEGELSDLFGNENNIIFRPEDSTSEKGQMGFEKKRMLNLVVSDAGMDVNSPNYHNNTTFDYLTIPGAAEFFSDLGSVVLDLVRDASKWQGFNGLMPTESNKHFVGISIDKTYGGVNVKQILNAIFINPLAFDPATNEEAVGISYHIALHEITHERVREEGAGFTSQLANVYKNIYGSNKYGYYEGLFRSVYSRHFDTFKQLKKEYDKSTTRNISKSFTGDKIQGDNSGTVQSDGNSIQDGEQAGRGADGDTANPSGDKIGDVIVSNITKSKPKNNINFRPNDIAYLELAKNPEANKDQLEEMVKEAANKAGYTEEAYHSTKDQFDSFDPNLSTVYGEFWFSDQPNKKEMQSSKEMKVFLKISNPTEDISFTRKRRIALGDETIEDEYSSLKGDGAISALDAFGSLTDSVIYKGNFNGAGSSSGNAFLVFSSSQIKSADPVTYDSSWNIIPLSQRFDETKNNINFRPESVDQVVAHERFERSSIENALNQNSKSREVLVNLPIDFFRSMVDSMEEEQRKDAMKFIESGELIREIPQMWIDEYYKDGPRVNGHEGRHRSLVLQELGYTHMPVMVLSSKIRWGMQNSPESFDYISEEEWPKTLTSEDGSKTILYPFSRDQFGQAKNNINYSPAQTKNQNLARSYKRLHMIRTGKLSDKVDHRTLKIMELMNQIKNSDIPLISDELQKYFFDLVDNIYESRKSAISDPAMRYNTPQVLQRLTMIKKGIDSTVISKMIDQYDDVIDFDSMDIDITDKNAVMNAINDYVRDNEIVDLVAGQSKDSQVSASRQKLYAKWRQRYENSRGSIVERYGDADNYVKEIEAMNGVSLKDDQPKIDSLKEHFNYLVSVDTSQMIRKELYQHAFAIDNMLDGSFYGIGSLTSAHIAKKRDAEDNIFSFAKLFRDPVVTANKFIQSLDEKNMLAELHQTSLQRLSHSDGVRRFVQEKLMGPIYDGIVRLAENRKMKYWEEFIQFRNETLGGEMTTEDRVVTAMAGRLLQSETGANLDTALMVNIENELDSINHVITYGSKDNQDLHKKRIKPLFEDMVKGLREYGQGSMAHFLDTLDNRLKGNENLEHGQKRRKVIEKAQEIFSRFTLGSKITSEGYHGKPFIENSLYIPNDVKKLGVMFENNGWKMTDPLAEIEEEIHKKSIKAAEGHYEKRKGHLGDRDYYSYNIEHIIYSSVERLSVDHATIGERFVLNHRIKKGSELNNIISQDENGVPHYDRVNFLEDMTYKLISNAVSRGAPLDGMAQMLRAATSLYAKPILSSVHHIITQPVASFMDYAVRTGNYKGWMEAAAYYAANVDKVNAWFKENQRWTGERAALEAMALDQRRSPIDDSGKSLRGHPIVKFIEKFYDGFGNLLTVFMRTGDHFAAKATVLAEYARLLKEKGYDFESFDEIDLGTTEGRILTQATLNAERNINTSNKILRGELYTDRRASLTVIRNLLFAFSSHSSSLATQFNQAVRDLIELQKLGAPKAEMASKARTIAAITLQQLTFISARFAIGSMLAKAMIALAQDLFDDDEGKIEELQNAVYLAQKKGDPVKVAIAENELQNAKQVRTIITKFKNSTQSGDSLFKQIIRDGSGAVYIGFNIGAVQQFFSFVTDAFMGHVARQGQEEVEKDLEAQIKIAKEKKDLKKAAKLTEQLVVIAAAKYIPLSFSNVGGVSLGGLYGGVLDQYKRTGSEIVGAMTGSKEWSFNDFMMMASTAGIGQSEFNKAMNLFDKIEDANWRTNAEFQKTGLPAAELRKKNKD